MEQVNLSGRKEENSRLVVIIEEMYGLSQITALLVHLSAETLAISSVQIYPGLIFVLLAFLHVEI